MRVYLSEDLIFKGKKRFKGGDGYTSPSGDQHATGEERGGSYVARARIGTEKDGSPMYRYFQDMDSYRTYLRNKGSAKRTGNYGKKAKRKDTDSDIEEKVKREHKQESKKVNKQRKERLYLKDKKGK